jgi:hypothetical protein
MSGVAITLMILVCGFVWGGFVLLLARAVRREGEKREGEKRGGETR